MGNRRLTALGNVVKAVSEILTKLSVETERIPGNHHSGVHFDIIVSLH